MITWARQFESDDRQVADNTINGCRVSTVWLGTDHNYLGGPPLYLKLWFLIHKVMIPT